MIKHYNEDRNKLLATLTDDQRLELLHQMREWALDCQWCDCDEEDINNMTDEELLQGIERNYSGGLQEFINTLILNQ